MSVTDVLENTDFSLREVFSKMHTMLIVPFSKIIGRGDIPGNELGTSEFITKSIMLNFAVSTAQSASTSLEALVAESLFVLGKYWYYKFLLNPQNVDILHSKLQAVEETSDMTIINTYRNASPTMNISGISGCTLPRDLMTATNTETKFPKETMARYPKLSAAWFKFRQLEKFYNEINSDIVIMYDMDLYVGKFVNLNYKQDADNPWVINYDMQFRLYPDMMLHTLSAYDYKTFFNTMLERYGKSVTKDFEGKSKKVVV